MKIINGITKAICLVPMSLVVMVMFFVIMWNYEEHDEK